MGHVFIGFPESSSASTGTKGIQRPHSHPLRWADFGRSEPTTHPKEMLRRGVLEFQSVNQLIFGAFEGQSPPPPQPLPPPRKKRKDNKNMNIYIYIYLQPLNRPKFWPRSKKDPFSDFGFFWKFRLILFPVGVFVAGDVFGFCRA